MIFVVGFGAFLIWLLWSWLWSDAAIPNRASVVSAISTAILAGSVLFTYLQLSQDRKFRQVQATGDIFNANEIKILRFILRKIDTYKEKDNGHEQNRIDRNRDHAYNLYKRITKLRCHKRHRKLAEKMNSSIRKITHITERLEIYIRRGIVSESLVAEHLGYYIVATYYFIQDILQDDARDEDVNYEGFRNLALRMQDISKINPVNAPLAEELKYAKLPPLRYASGGESVGYPRSFLLRIRLCWHCIANVCSNN